MKRFTKSLGYLVVAALVLGGCKDKTPQNVEESGTSSQTAAAITGKVVSTENAGGYTYVEIESGGKKIWAAGPATEVKVGDRVTIPDGMVMTNFESKSLNRTFESILFVGAIQIEDAAAAPVEGEQAHGVTAPQSVSQTEAPAKGSIEKAQGGYNLEELIAKKDSLNGKEVAVRGKVMKVNKNIMGKHWLHIQDGTGKEGNHDVVVTTTQDVNAGDIVLAKATLNVDKDFGSGYKFDIILEDAQITVE